MAELDNTTTVDSSTNEPSVKNTDNAQVDYKTQYEEMMIENAKLKKAMDKAASEAANNKRLLREKQSAEEIAAQEKAEREAEIAEMNAEKDRKLAMYESKDLLRQHFGDLDSETVEKIVEADINGEKSVVYETLAKYFDGVIEQRLNAQKSDLLGSRPPVSTGSNGADSTLTKEKIMAVRDSIERQRLIAEHRELFD